MPSKIQVLPDHVANQIAAGEVIERPSAVLKELLENSLDAGATAVDIAFEQAGIASIVIQDNGSGMTPEDARLSLVRHATSKLRDTKDLEAILTFGFRGEAVPSIASVSRFSLKTRTVDSDVGYCIEVEGGTLRTEKPCGMPVGTHITVRDLFYNVPARRKFLKSATTEASHLVNIARTYALAEPQVAFDLKVDGRQSLRLAAANNLRERVSELLGADVAAHLIPIELSEQPQVKLSGFIGHPKFHRPNREGIFYFVNRRPIDSKLMQYALLEAFRGHLPEGRFPWAFLSLQIDPNAVDVNVHPAKREVRFRDEGTVRAQVMHALIDTLHRIYEHDNLSKKPLFIAQPSASHSQQSTMNTPAAALSIPSPAFTPTQRTVAPKPGHTKTDVLKGVQPTHFEARETPVQAPIQKMPWRFLAALPPRWLLFQTQSDALMIVYAKAARERILYEEVLSAMQTSGVRAQTLLVPITFDLTPNLKEAWEHTQSSWASFGYAIEPFGRHTYRVLETPPWLDPYSCVEMLEALLSDIHEKSISAKHELLWAEFARRIAARPSSLSALSYDARTATALLERLFKCKHPLTSPGKHATVWEITPGMLAKHFGVSTVG